MHKEFLEKLKRQHALCVGVDGWGNGSGSGNKINTEELENSATKMTTEIKHNSTPSKINIKFL